MLVPVGTNNEDHKAQLSLMMEKAEDGDVKWKCVCKDNQREGLGNCQVSH